MKEDITIYVERSIAILTPLISFSSLSFEKYKSIERMTNITMMNTISLLIISLVPKRPHIHVKKFCIPDRPLENILLKIGSADANIGIRKITAIPHNSNQPMMFLCIFGNPRSFHCFGISHAIALNACFTEKKIFPMWLIKSFRSHSTCPSP